MPKGWEIITSPFTFVSTTNAIVRAGYKPVFCDIDRDNFTIDADSIEKLITKDTVAILLIHVYENVCNVEKIQEIANKYKLKVLYDGAHAFGVECKDKSVLTYGDASILSFHATKVFNTIEGRAICTNNKEIYEKSNIIRDFGISCEDDVEFIDPNAKMNEFCVAMRLCNLKLNDENISKRKDLYNHYSNSLANVKVLIIPKEKTDVKSNYAYYPIVIEDNFKCTRD